MKQDPQASPTLTTLIELLQRTLPSRIEHHTLILYGSWARGQETESSDVDLFCVGDGGEPHRVSDRHEGHQLDLWYYPSEAVPEASGLHHLHGGIVLCERDGLATRLLKDVAAHLEIPPPPMPAWEQKITRLWYQKTLRRCRQAAQSGAPDGPDAIEAHYRRHWTLFESLTLWFAQHRRHYPGPKQAIRQLQSDDPEAYDAFGRAIQPGASLDDIEAWLSRF